MGQQIKNYTSTVPIERTIASIEKELVKIGVTHIEKSYSDGVPVGIIFTVDLQKKKVSFKIPSNIDAAYDVIIKIPAYKRKSKTWLKAQAGRTAWKIILNWVEVWVSMVQLKQAEAMQMLLAFAYDKKTNQTFYEKVSGDGYKMLT